jgi:sugar lactone lactonase YvrE
MAIENRKCICRLARAGVGLFLGALSVCGGAAGQSSYQPAVTTGSVVTIPSSTTWGQVYKIVFYDGSVLALDAANDALYQLSPGATAWSCLTPGPNGCKGGFLGSGYNTQGMAIDAVGTLYLTIAYPNSQDGVALFWRVPYDAKDKTWKPTSSSGWGGGETAPNDGGGDQIVDSNGNTITGQDKVYSDEVFFLNSPKRDGSGTLYWWETTNPIIWAVAVDKNGNADQPQGNVMAYQIVDQLKEGQGKMTVDVNGNIYFVEYHAATNLSRATGVFFISAAQVADAKNGNPITGTNGTAEQQLQRIDAAQASSASPIVYAGVTLDEAGNLYLDSENNSSYNETVAGLWKVPNECGGPTKVDKASCLNYSDISMLAPFSGNQPVAIDPRGYIWDALYQDPSAPGSGPYPGVYAILVWAPGSLNLGASPALITGPAGIVQPGPAGTEIVTFNQPVTLSAIQLAQLGGGSDFAFTSTNPNPASPPATTSPQCTPGTVYTAQSSCLIWVGLNARAPGAVSGQMTLSGMVGTSTTATYVPGSTVYLSGIGQGAEAAMLASPAPTAIAAGLKTPAQVAADPLGNTYVADPGLGAVEMYPAGSAAGTTGTSVGTGLTKPTGVAVDGSGDVYIADSGKVFEIPAVNGSIVGQTQITIASGLGSNLNLAADGLGNVYVADAKNAQVVKIPNPAADFIPSGFMLGANGPTTLTVGEGFVTPLFTQPTAIAVDNAGDLFVADNEANGTALVEITPWDQATTITNTLVAPVTGLAVDASGSVIVSQQGGILRIPYVVTSTSSGLNISDESPLGTTITPPITQPNGVALDQHGNLYVTDMTNGPNLYELAVNGTVNFGNALSPQDPADAQVALYDIGNENLLVGTPIVFSGPDVADFAALSGGTCGATGVTPGSACTVEVSFTPPAKGTYTGDSMAVPTNAGNVGGGNISASLSGIALENLVPTQTAIGSVIPAGSTYPGSTTVTVTVTPEPTDSIPANGNTPSGPVTLTLTNVSTQVAIQQTQQASGNASGTTATFTLSGIQGGTYCVTAAYGGNVTALYKPSNSPACSTTAPYSPPGTTFIVAPTPPVITLSEPLGVSANSQNGIYYVKAGQTAITLTANVSSTLGAPTGSITFMNGSTVEGTSQLDANGNAVFVTNVLAIGSYNLTAVYSGDQNFASTNSPAVAFQVIAPSVLITANPKSVTTPAGTPVAATITLQSLAGFAANTGVNITCNIATIPYYAECTFVTNQPGVAQQIICAPQTGSSCTGISTAVVTITSNIPVNLPPSATASVRTHGTGASPLIPAGIFGLGLFGLALRRRAIFNRYLLNVTGLVLLLAGAAMGFGGCTNSSYTQQIKVQKYTTPSGTYNVSIQVTDPSSGAVESLPFTLPVTIQ